MAGQRLRRFHPRLARGWECDITPLCAARGSGQNYLRLRPILLDDSFFLPVEMDYDPSLRLNLFHACITSAVTNIDPADKTMLPSFSDNSSACWNADSTGLTALDSSPASSARRMIC